MRRVAAVVLMFWVALAGFAATPTKRRPVTRRAQTAAVSSRKTPARKGTARRRRGTSARAQTRQTWRAGQMAPTPERYKEVQTALAARGYTSQTPDGVWSPEWAGALKRFQQDRKLEPTGRLNSLSLITLGLGPKRGADAVPPPAAPANQSRNSAMRILQ